jgi:hypothetical protein
MSSQGAQGKPYLFYHETEQKLKLFSRGVEVGRWGVITAKRFRPCVVSIMKGLKAMTK